MINRNSTPSIQVVCTITQTINHDKAIIRFSVKANVGFCSSDEEAMSNMKVAGSTPAESVEFACFQCVCAVSFYTRTSLNWL